MSANWHVGMKVVCIDDTNYIVTGHRETLPRKGVVYTIRGLIERGDGLGVCLEEIVNQPHRYTSGFVEAHFLVRRFRPVVTDKTQFSLLETIVRRVDKRTRIPAGATASPSGGFTGHASFPLSSRGHLSPVPEA